MRRYAQYLAVALALAAPSGRADTPQSALEAVMRDVAATNDMAALSSHVDWSAVWRATPPDRLVAYGVRRAPELRDFYRIAVGRPSEVLRRPIRDLVAFGLSGRPAEAAQVARLEDAGVRLDRRFAEEIVQGLATWRDVAYVLGQATVSGAHAVVRMHVTQGRDEITLAVPMARVGDRWLLEARWLPGIMEGVAEELGRSAEGKEMAAAVQALRTAWEEHQKDTEVRQFASAWANAVEEANLSLPAEITLSVRDEQGATVEGARVSVTLAEAFGWKGESRGQTDAAGLYKAVSEVAKREISWVVVRDGFYQTRGGYEFTARDERGWTPRNPTQPVLLRPALNPVPLIARRIQTAFPAYDAWVGFDLEVGDWTSPHGQGRLADFRFLVRRTGQYVPQSETHVLLQFSNPADGIVSIAERDLFRGSSFLLPRFAPESGYRDRWAKKFRGIEPSWNMERKQGQSLYSFFRVRSGGGGGARYGKLSPFGLNGYELGEVRVSFTYHLNPDGTRNLEFAPERNLATGEAAKVQALP